VCVFGEMAEIAWPFDSFKKKSELYNAIDNLKYEGDIITVSGDALHLIFKRLHPLTRSNVTHMVILFTGGEQIGGTHDWLAEAEKMKTSGIRIFAIHVGSSYNGQYLDTIASGRS
jgi:hypothetical protein